MPRGRPRYGRARRTARHVVGLGEAGRDRAAEPDPPGRARQPGEQGHRLEHVHEHRKAAPGVQVVGARRRRVGDEEQIEAALLGELGERRGSSRCRSSPRRWRWDAATRPDARRTPGRSAWREKTSTACSRPHPFRVWFAMLAQQPSAGQRHGTDDFRLACRLRDRLLACISSLLSPRMAGIPPPGASPAGQASKARRRFSRRRRRPNAADSMR